MQHGQQSIAGGPQMESRRPAKTRSVRVIMARLIASKRRQRGQSLVELALVTPLILLLFAGAGDLGRAFYGFIAIENAVKEGVL